MSWDEFEALFHVCESRGCPLGFLIFPFAPVFDSCCRSSHAVKRRLDRVGKEKRSAQLRRRPEFNDGERF